MIVLARKPLSEATVAANVLKWGTGAINVDGCRIDSGGTHGSATRAGRGKGFSETIGHGIYNDVGGIVMAPHPFGRWPANVIHDGSEEVVAAFPDSDHARGNKETEIRGGGWFGDRFVSPAFAGDEGSAARFFYTAKADSDDRLGSKHPTVKPLDLIQYLVRLITPPKGVCLDPFAGTGTTGEAAWREGMSAVLIEREEEYCADIRRRMALALSGPDERRFQAMKERLNGKPMDAGPLFSGQHFDDESERPEVEPEPLLPPVSKRDDGPLFEWIP
jgi:site-specific DNA-methyltransferase (adenine-specific)